jgi:hypothetical protein
MPLFFLYILKLSISLAGVWLFYQLLLRRLTFYNWNRFYLLGYCTLAFFIPLINITPIIEGNSAATPVMIRFIPAIGDYYIPVRVTAGATETHWATSYLWTVLSVLLLTGFLILVIRLCIRYASVRRIRRRGRPMQENGLLIYAVEEDIIPFSFGNSIFINPRLHTEREWDEIILHEYVHVRQKHILDILFSELLCALNWYNPFVWLIRHSIRQNLEFIADGKVLEKGLDKKGYQYHLLKVIGRPEYRLANNFNFSSLKKRIIMMNKIRSAKFQLVKFLFILPLIAVLLLAFREDYKDLFRDRYAPVFINNAGIVIDISNHRGLGGVIVTEKRTGLHTVTDPNGFYKLRLPVGKDSIRIHIDFSKEGYEPTFDECYIPTVKETMGRLSVNFLIPPSYTSGKVFMGFPFMKKVPVDPVYEDALAALKETEQVNNDVGALLQMQKDHPEVGLFYTFEDHSKHIVIYTDGRVERYGYPDGPTVADMEKKFGHLPDMITRPDPAAGKYYMADWARISAVAEKLFHTNNPDARAIIFPGDSRVIAVPVSGKPQVYDMDNADPKERPAFEKLYGKLPDVVPVPGVSARVTLVQTGSSPVVPVTRAVAVPTVAAADTVPVKPEGDHSGVSAGVTKSWPNWGTQTGTPLYILDGVMMPDGWSVNMIPPDSIKSINIIKKDATSHFGPRAINGVVVISTRVRPPLPAPSAGNHLAESLPKPKPLFIVDGVETDSSKLGRISPADIESISVFKDSAAIKKYGAKARNGVIEIYVKNKSVSNQLEMIYTDSLTREKMILRADTIRLQ